MSSDHLAPYQPSMPSEGESGPWLQLQTVSTTFKMSEAEMTLLWTSGLFGTVNHLGGKKTLFRFDSKESVFIVHVMVMLLL